MHLPQIGVKHEVGHHTSALALRVGLAFAPLIFLIAAPYRACIRSAHLFDRCALSGLHSLRSSQTASSESVGKIDEHSHN